VERWLLIIADVPLVAVALDSPIRGLERLGAPGEPFPPSQSFWVSASLAPGIIWLRFCDGRMPS
jgi:hypothetical protein